ncbi:hypothetical protein FBALC1_11847 [Flavobacteriales bacterium ALC-1]|nr:hypothetical protein FBALC1_11847 [Flavobacteriales bacterium ALC-1]
MKKNKLHNVKSTGFKTPDNYFESFDDKLFDYLTEKDEITGIETSGHTVPKDYFNTVEKDILSKLNIEEKPVVALKSRTTFYYVVGMAASFVLLFSIFLSDNDITLDTIDTVDIESFLYQEDYTSDELAALFITNEISETDFIDVQIPEDTFDQYIETIDTEDYILD